MLIEISPGLFRGSVLHQQGPIMKTQISRIGEHLYVCDLGPGVDLCPSKIRHTARKDMINNGSQLPFSVGSWSVKDQRGCRFERQLHLLF